MTLSSMAVRAVRSHRTPFGLESGGRHPEVNLGVGAAWWCSWRAWFLCSARRATSRENGLRSGHGVRMRTAGLRRRHPEALVPRPRDRHVEGTPLRVPAREAAGCGAHHAREQRLGAAYGHLPEAWAGADSITGSGPTSSPPAAARADMACPGEAWCPASSAFLGAVPPGGPAPATPAPAPRVRRPRSSTPAQRSAPVRRVPRAVPRNARRRGRRPNGRSRHGGLVGGVGRSSRARGRAALTAPRAPRSPPRNSRRPAFTSRPTAGACGRHRGRGTPSASVSRSAAHLAVGFGLGQQFGGRFGIKVAR